MTLKEELEILRGEPIEVFESDPMDIPCIETSDPEKLCKHPVVSVHMLTYNHEPYIRQAIEGVMMQQTDFEFELVIGEDCSQDKTREICFEYQKKYPDKIRVLWWHENVSKFGGNGRRNRAHCRGEFMAICEGDDYWIDPLKLQKQVDVMRKYPSVGFCFCGSKYYYQADSRFDDWNKNGYYKPGIQKKDWFFTVFMFGMGPKYNGKESNMGFIMTATTMLRKTLHDKILKQYEIFKWRLRLGDATIWLGCSANMDGYYIDEQVSVYRVSNSGIFHNKDMRSGIIIDGIIVRLYFLVEVWKLRLKDCPIDHIQWLVSLAIGRMKNIQQLRMYALSQFRLPISVVVIQYRWYMIPFWIISILGIRWRLAQRGAHRIITCGRFLDATRSVVLLEKYKNVGLL